MELVSQGNVICCPHIGIAQLVKCEEADWPSCAHTIRRVMTQSLCEAAAVTCSTFHIKNMASQFRQECQNISTKSLHSRHVSLHQM